MKINRINIEKIAGGALLVFSIAFNLWVYRLEPTALVDPNDNTFQYALVHRTNEAWDYALRLCESEKLQVKNVKFPNLPHCTLHFALLFDHWVPNWAEGYNLPYYYSHVPQIVIVALYRLFSFIVHSSQFTVTLFSFYHTVIYVLLSFFPLSVFLALLITGLSPLTAGFGSLVASHISADGLYGLEPASYLWRGYGLSSQLFAAIWLPLALAYAWRYFQEQKSVKSQNSFNRKIDLRFNHLTIIRSGLPAVLFLTATTAGHLGIGIIAFLSVGILAVSVPIYVLFQSLTPNRHSERSEESSPSSPPFAKGSRTSLPPFAKGRVGVGLSPDTRHSSAFGLRMIPIQDMFPALLITLKKLFILYGGVFLLLGYWIIPVFLHGDYHNTSFWDSIWKFDSFGYREVLKNLFDGNMFDFERLPVLTVLVFIGIFGAVRGKIFADRFPSSDTGNADMEYSGTARPETGATASSGARKFFPEQQRPYAGFSLLFIFWLLLYFGRTTWGGLIDLIPGMTEFHLSRFIVGVQIAGLFLIPMGYETIVSSLVGYFVTWFKSCSPNRHVRPIVAFVVLVVFVVLVYPQTLRYSAHNDFLIRRGNDNFRKQQADADLLLSTVKRELSTNPGRVYFGRGSNWGKDLKVAETEYYLYFSSFGIPTVLWLPQTWSPNSDTEQFFTDSRPEDYDLFNIRYVVTTPAEKPRDFWKLIKESSSWKLYEVVLSTPLLTQSPPSDSDSTIPRFNDSILQGFFTTGIRPAVVGSSKLHYKNLVHQWIQSDYPRLRLFPQLVISNHPTIQPSDHMSLPYFIMTDESTYRVPDGSFHSLFSEPPTYMIRENGQWIKPGEISRLNDVTIHTVSSDTDMVYKASVEVRADCSDCLVILKSSYHPSWTATIDGKKADVISVFPFYNAVLLEQPGTHEVVFSYRPSGLKVVLLAVFLTSLLCLTLGFLRFSKI